MLIENWTMMRIISTRKMTQNGMKAGPRLQSSLTGTGLTVIASVVASATIWLFALHLYGADLIVNKQYNINICNIAN
eukprot:14576348-Ditylum_brightwellii.AAC.1